jgi:hypothetical protein
MKRKLILAGIIIAAFLIGGAGVYFLDLGVGRIPGKLSPQQAADKTINYINQNKDTLTGGETVSLVSVTEENGLYKAQIKLGDNQVDIYVTKNGKLLFPAVAALDLEPTPTATPQASGNASSEVQKRDKPDVKLFVMSYCPYGLQAQKMFLPVYNLLEDKAEMGVYFVNYVMHGKQEIDENLRQYCIEKEQKDKYYNYLSCFVQAGNFDACLIEANIDKNKMNSCISATDAQYGITQGYNDKSTWISGQYPKFDVNDNLNQQYGVQGSPTIVINDTIVEIASRSPEVFKEVICNAFNTPPSECSQSLSDEIVSTSFGTGTGSSNGGGCEQ